MAFNNQAELDKYFRIIQPKHLLGKYRVVDFKGNPANELKFVKELVELLINTGEGQSSSGIPTMREIVQTINHLLAKSGDDDIDKKQFNDFIRVFCDGDIINGSSEVYWRGDKKQKITFHEVLKSGITRPNLGVVMTSSPFITMNVRDTNKIAVFMNAIPTLEFSRAQPFLDVRFQFDRAKKEGEQRLSAPSLIKFLDGAVVPQGADKLMSDALVDKQILNGGQESDVYRAGMELFTSPQTLVNASNARPTSRYVRAIDPFRPFLTIEQFEVQADRTVGLFSYKTAKLTLTLHDRSRLGEISDLVRPEIYTRTTLSISYGWSHPDKVGGQNAFGDLMNRMIIQNEKYGIVNCSFQFDAVGQCKITLQLAMKGVQDLRVVNISDSESYQNQTKMIDQLMQDVANLREDAGLKKPEGLGKEVRAYQVIDMVERGELIYDAQQIKEIRELTTKLRKATGKNKDAAQELAKKFDALFSEKKGLVEVLKKTIEGNINEKFKELEEGEDPFLDRDENGNYSKEIQAFIKEPETGKRKAKRVASLAKVFLTFVGKSIQTVQNVDEVQFFFYQFNSQAGQLGDTNIGAFPVEIQELRDVFMEHAKEKGNPNLSVYEFAQLLQGAIIQNPRAIGYGLRQAYTPKNGKKESDVKPGKDISDFLSNAVKNKGSFRYPQVEAYIETLGGRPVAVGELASEKSGHDIMRIHIYDKTSSPYDPMLQMTRSQTDLQDVINRDPKSDKNAQAAQATIQGAIQLANDAGLNIQYDEKLKKYKLGSASNQALKDFITQVIPTITYGSNNSAVTNATMQTQQIPLLSTTQMMKTAGRQNNTEPNGSAAGGIPLRVIPTQLDINTFGCPLFNINQQFFVDFQTGTTVDNIYLLTHLTHTIKQGKFETHIKMVPLDAYGVYESVTAKIDQIKGYLGELSAGSNT